MRRRRPKKILPRKTVGDSLSPFEVRIVSAIQELMDLEYYDGADAAMVGAHVNLRSEWAEQVMDDLVERGFLE